MPNCVIPCRSIIISQKRSGSGWSGAPSYITTVPPDAWFPISVHGPIIQPMSETQKNRSAGFWSKPKWISLAHCVRTPAWVWTIPFGSPVVPEEYNSMDS